jgi:hypothetical protein
MKQEKTRFFLQCTQNYRKYLTLCALALTFIEVNKIQFIMQDGDSDLILEGEVKNGGWSIRPCQLYKGNSEIHSFISEFF